MEVKLEKALRRAWSPTQINDHTQALLKESVERMSTLVTEKKRLKAENEELQKSINLLQEELNQERKIKWGSNAKIMSEVRRKAQDTESRAERARKRLKEATAELDKMKDINQVLKVQVKLLNEKLSEKSSAEKENSDLQVQNSKLSNEKKALEAEVISLKEKVRKEELKNAENALDLHLEKEKHALEMVVKKDEIVKMGELLSNNRGLLNEIKVNFEKMLQTTLAPIEAKIKDYDERVSELKAEKEALEKKLERTDQTMGTGFDGNELQKLRSHRSELTKMGEKLAVALKQSKAEKTTIENQLKVVKLEAAKTEEKRKILEDKLAEEKKRHLADVKILKDEKAALEVTREKELQLALKEKEVEIAQEQLSDSEAQNWQDKFEESLRRRERMYLVGKEENDGESNLSEQECLNEEQSSLVSRGEYQSNCCPHAVLTKLILNLEFLLKLTWILIPS